MRATAAMVCSLAVFFSILSGLNAQMQARGSFKNIQIHVKFLNTPQITVDNYPNSLKSDTKWLAFEVSYTAPRIATGQNNYDWLDDVTMEVDVLFPAAYKGQEIMALMTGSTTYWSIQLDGKKHQALMAVPPQVIARYSRPGTKYKENTILARVSFYTKNRILLGSGISDVKNVSERKAYELFEKYSGPVSNALKLENFILSRSKTPWAFIQYDYYDMIKEQVK
ncbi:MAG: hypothetical protein WC071_07800 [Victivallaceae bacterium]